MPISWIKLEILYKLQVFRFVFQTLDPCFYFLVPERPTFETSSAQYLSDGAYFDSEAWPSADFNDFALQRSQSDQNLTSFTTTFQQQHQVQKELPQQNPCHQDDNVFNFSEPSDHQNIIAEVRKLSSGLFK